MSLRDLHALKESNIGYLKLARERQGKQEKEARDHQELLTQRAELVRNIKDGQLSCISSQRLKELYPNDDLDMIIKRFKKLGVDIFDGTDVTAKRISVANQLQYSTSELLSTSDFRSKADGRKAYEQDEKERIVTKLLEKRPETAKLTIK